MDRKKCKEIREILEANVFEALEEKFNVRVTVGAARFDDANVTFKIEFADVTEDGEVRDTKSENFKRECYRFGLEPDDLGSSFLFRGEMYKIVGLKPRSYKYPVLAERSDGRSFKFAADLVKRNLIKV